MAAAGCCTTFAALTAALLLLATAALGPSPVGASWITVFEGPGCAGNSETYYFYCHTITQRGGYNFVYADYEAGFLFPKESCAREHGDPPCPALVANTRNCSGVPFRSIYISKPPPLPCIL